MDHVPNFLKVCLLLLLAICSYSDVKEKKILLWPLAAGALTAVLFKVIFHSGSFMDSVLGMLLGALFTSIAIVTKGKIGIGDGLVFFVTGIFLGWQDNLVLIMVSFLLAALVSAAIILFKKKSMKIKIPFVPYILVADLIILALY